MNLNFVQKMKIFIIAVLLVGIPIHYTVGAVTITGPHEQLGGVTNIVNNTYLSGGGASPFTVLSAPLISANDHVVIFNGTGGNWIIDSGHMLSEYALYSDLTNFASHGYVQSEIAAINITPDDDSMYATIDQLNNQINDLNETYSTNNQLNNQINDLNSTYETIANVSTQLNTKQNILHPTISIHAQSVFCPTNNGCTELALNESISGHEFVGVDFPNTGFPNASFGYLMPDNWNGGPIKYKVIWTSNAGDGDVIFNMAGYCDNDNGAISLTYNSDQSITDTMQTKDNIYISSYSSPLLLGGTLAGGEMCYFHTGRNGGTLNNPATVLGWVIQYDIT